MSPGYFPGGIVHFHGGSRASCKVFPTGGIYGVGRRVLFRRDAMPMAITVIENPPDANDPRKDRSRDSAILHDLYVRYGQIVFRTAYRITESRSDAEDVLQDVFVGLPEALRSYTGRGSLEGWIRRIAGRAALAKLRRRKRRAEVPIQDGSDFSSAGPCPDAAVERTALLGALEKLPDDLRIVFALKEIEGYSHDEIGRLLGIRTGTSEVRLHRAKRQLRDLLGGQS